MMTKESVNNVHQGSNLFEVYAVLSSRDKLFKIVEPPTNTAVLFVKMDFI